MNERGTRVSATRSRGDGKLGLARSVGRRNSWSTLGTTQSEESMSSERKDGPKGLILYSMRAVLHSSD